jgi:adsorption protein A
MNLNSMARSSKKVVELSIFLLMMVCAPSTFAQSDWSKDLSARQRFMVFPHVDAGFRALNQKRFDTAIVEFKRAIALAPQNAALVGYLAETYAASGDLEKAIRTIDSKEVSIIQTSQLLELKRLYTQRMTSLILKKAESLKDNAVLLRQYLKDNQPILDSAYAESVWIELLALSSTPKDNLLQSYIQNFSENKFLKQRLSLLMLTKLEAFPQANQLIDQLSLTDLAPFSQVDSLSYTLLSQGNPDQALRLLIKAFPFAGASTAERYQLLNRLLIAESRANDKGQMKSFLENQRSQIQTSAQEREWLTLMGESVGQQLKPFVDYQIQYRDNASLLVAELQRRLQSGAQLPAEVDWEETIAGLGPTIDTLLDTLTYRLVEAGSNAAAWDLMMARYPFNGMSSLLREKFVTRLDMISLRQPSLLVASAQTRLSIPLDNVRLRGLQAAMLKHVGDCTGVRKVLGDLSNLYTASDWMMLGECYLKQQRSGLAQYAFEQAIKRQPTTEATRALAYVAYQNKNNVLAVQAWKETIASGKLTSENWLAATITALAADEKNLATQWLEQYEQTQGKQTADYWAVKAGVLSAESVLSAIVAMQTSLEIEPRASRYAELAGWQRQVGDTSGAIVSLNAAIALAPNDGAIRTDLGFLEYNLGDLPEAQVQMQAALRLRPNDMRVTEQLAYIDQRLGDNDQSKRYIEESVDHLLRYPPQEQTPVRTESLYALRRMYEDLSRRWTLSVDGMSSSSPAASAQSPVPGQDFKSYSQIEFDYRLGDPAINDGKTVSVYGRVFGGSGPNNAALPVYAPMLGIGLRWKPFSDYVIYFAAEKQIPLDQGTSASANTMLRVSASFLNTGRYSDDWHPTGSGWFSQNLYLDSAYYLSTQAYALTADYRFGYHHKLQQGQTIEPYTRLVATKISSETSPDVRVGLGVRWNIWANQSRYSAYASKYYVGLEVQGAIKTYQNDRFAALLTMGVRW